MTEGFGPQQLLGLEDLVDQIEPLHQRLVEATPLGKAPAGIDAVDEIHCSSPNLRRLHTLRRVKATRNPLTPSRMGAPSPQARVSSALACFHLINCHSLQRDKPVLILIRHPSQFPKKGL
jgi:hypothetical protein